MNVKLKMKLLKLGKRQIRLAQETGIPESYLSKVVNGWIEPKMEMKQKIAKALGCRIADIFEG